MGGVNVLGSVAEGFNQASRLDQQRQFEAEMDRRRQIGDFLGKLAQDETAHPASRQAAIQEAFTLHNTPFNKPYKLDVNKLVTPYQGPTQTDTQAPPPSTGQVASLLPGGARPPIPPPGMQLPAVAQYTPPPSQGVYLTPEELAQQKAQQAQILGAEQTRHAVEQAKALAAIETQAKVNEASALADFRRQQLEKAGGNLPEAVFATSGQIPFALTRPFNSGTETAGNLRSMGYKVPDSIPDDQYVKMETSTGGLEAYSPTVPPASMMGKSTSSSQSMSQSGGINTTRTTTPVLPGGKGKPATATAPTPPPGKAAAPSVTTTQKFRAVDFNDKNPVAQAGIRWATQGQKPAGGAMGERQVLTWMAQHGLKPSLPVPPAMAKSIKESFVARDSAIGLIDDVMKNIDVFDSLLSSGKIQLASEPQTGRLLLTRVAGLTDKEAKVAGDFMQLTEHANLLRGPLGATGFRGQEAWAALQAQRGQPIADPRITKQVLTGMRERLVGLNSADAMILPGQGQNFGTGVSAPAAPPGQLTNFHINPTTGEKIGWNGSAWVPAQ